MALRRIGWSLTRFRGVEGAGADVRRLAYLLLFLHSVCWLALPSISEIEGELRVAVKRKESWEEEQAQHCRQK